MGQRRRDSDYDVSGLVGKTTATGVGKNARRASKRDVAVEAAELNTTFVEGIKSIYDETPVRQGRKFWHYGKDAAELLVLAR